MGQYKKVTSTDVARLAGVSQSTVSQILSHSPRANFSQETVRRVFQCAEQLGYQPLKSSVRAVDEVRNILVVCPGFTNPYYTLLLEAIRLACTRAGYGMLIFTTMRWRDEEERLLSLVSRMPVQGIVYTYCPESLDSIRQLCRMMPLVLVGDKAEQLAVDAVELDSGKCGDLVARHLLDLGHRRIAYLTIPTTLEQLARQRRLHGMEQTFLKAGIRGGILLRSKGKEQLGQYESAVTEYSVGYDLTRELIQQPQDVTAIVGLNDMVAMGAMDALCSEGLRVPEDYSVIGCDNTAVGHMRNVPLTTVDHHINAKGRQAVEMLLKKIGDADVPEQDRSRIMRVEYEPRLIARGSTGPARAAK